MLRHANLKTVAVIFLISVVMLLLTKFRANIFGNSETEETKKKWTIVAWSGLAGLVLSACLVIF